MPQPSLRFRPDTQAVREVVVSREDLPEVEISKERRGLAVGQTLAGLLIASTRLIGLLDTSEDIPFLE